MQAPFRGRERYFYIRAVYRQHGYRPLSSCWARRTFRSDVGVLHRFRISWRACDAARSSLRSDADLIAPDGLLMGMNLLPFVMTAINVVRGIRLRG